MKDFAEANINRWRIRHGRMSSDDRLGNCGAFRIPRDYRSCYMVIAADGQADTQWEHVSVRVAGKGKNGSAQDSTPTWRDMCHIKSLFFEPCEVVVQYHPPEEDYVNQHPHVLHLWRLRDVTMPMPPRELV